MAVNSERTRQPGADSGSLVERAIWVLGKDHLSVPACYRLLLSAVLRLGDITPSSGMPPWLRAGLRWDRLLTERHTEGGLSEDSVVWASAVERLVSARLPVIASLDLEWSLRIQQQIGRAVYWMSIEGQGATSPQAIWGAWVADRPSFQVELSIIDQGRVEQRGRREFRMSRTSPALAQYEALRGGAVLVTEEARRTERRGSHSISSFSSEATTAPRRRGRASAALRGLCRIVVRRMRNRVVSHEPYQWLIGIAQCSRERPGASGLTLPPMSSFAWIEPGRDRQLADPFLVDLAEEKVLFFEELPYATWRGRLKAVALDRAGEPRGPEAVVLDRPYHLSFPNVFRADSDPESLYLLPEQFASGHTVLYRSTLAGRLDQLRFTEHCVLLRDFAGIDPVLYRADPHWYLFVSNGAFGNLDNNLYLFVSTRLEGPYTPHPASPIREGLRGARMAGQLLHQQGELLRLGQDCVTGYGAGVVVFRVDTLTAEDYAETEVQVVDRASLLPGSLGVHSLTAASSLMAVDVLRTRR